MAEASHETPVDVQAFPLSNDELADVLGGDYSQLEHLASLVACSGCLLQDLPNPSNGEGRHKVCSVCKKEGLLVQKDRVRRILWEQRNEFKNGDMRTFWKNFGSGGQYRTVNNNERCQPKSPLVIWKCAGHIPDYQFQELPNEWRDGEYLRLTFRNGTFAPPPAASHVGSSGSDISKTLPVGGLRQGGGSGAEEEAEDEPEQTGVLYPRH